MRKKSLKKIFFIFFLTLILITGMFFLVFLKIFVPEFSDKIIQPKIIISLSIILTVLVLIASGLSFYLLNIIKSSLKKIIKGVNKASDGNFNYRIEQSENLVEFDQVVESFNNMLSGLDNKESNSKVSTEKLLDINTRYLDLVGFVSHELKGILSSIILNAYNLKNEILGPLNPSQKKTLASISRNLDYLNNTVQNFLSLSRIEKGEMELNKALVEFKSEVLEPSLEAFIQWIDERKIKVENNIKEDLIVNADLNHIQIVMNNLISNAIKYGFQEGTLIINKKLSGNYVEIEVYSDSKPIEKVDLEKLFKKFSRLVYRGTERVKGTGIGLFISKEIVEAHGGRIWAEPKTTGNSFKFTLEIK